MIMKKLAKLFGVVLLFCIVSNSFAYDDYYSGWWYVKNKSGTGVSLEIQGNNCFVAIFDYDKRGEPDWISSFGQVAKLRVDSEQSSNATVIFNGGLYLWRGWPLGSPYVAPSVIQIGFMEIIFYSTSHAILTYTIFKEFLNVNYNITIDAELTKFMPDLFEGSLDKRNINGWWYDPDYNGMGFFTEAYGNHIFLAWYHYGENGEPRWLSCYSPFTPSDTQFTCTMQEWSGGSFMGSKEYKPPVAKNLEEAVFKLIDEEEGRAELTWRGVTYHIQRFKVKVEQETSEEQ